MGAGIGLAFFRFGVWAEAEEVLPVELVVVDSATARPTPARVELLDSSGQAHVADDGLLIGGDPIDRETVWEGTLEQAQALLKRRLMHPFRRNAQFYTDGTSQLRLPAGHYTVRVEKGPEYELATLPFDVAQGHRNQVRVELTRWIDMASRGWYSSDNHLHIARSHPGLDAQILTWLQAEDIRVSTLLQWGNPRRFHNAVQYAFGPESVYREGDYLLASGQENPRTHLLGHTILLGGKAPINFPDDYLLYRLFWEEARKQGGVAGFAHAGIAAGAQNGLSIDLPAGLTDFLEVLQFGQGEYNVWYSILNSGFRYAPTAGSDYPFGGTIPGRERFYVRVDGPLTYPKWLEALRQGKTFATNGPLLKLEVNGRGPGDDLLLKKPDNLQVNVSVEFDPLRDGLERVELVMNGEIRKVVSPVPGGRALVFDAEIPVQEAGWLALRAFGRKPDTQIPQASLAHTGAVYFHVEMGPPITRTARAKTLARIWLARLMELQSRVFSQRESVGLSAWDEGVSAEYLKNNRERLLQEIGRAREYFSAQAE